MVMPDSASTGLLHSSAVIDATVGASKLLFIANLQWSTKRRPVWRDQEVMLRAGTIVQAKSLVEAQV
jgi:hypothetical protein